MPSLFSKIIAREIPAHIVYEDEYVIAFLDINPVNPGHTLVVPKEERQNVLESSEEDLHRLIVVIRKLAPVILKAVHATGFNVTTNTGEASGQSVPHTHFHIIPRYPNDGHAPWQHTPQTESQFLEVQQAITNELTV